MFIVSPVIYDKTLLFKLVELCQDLLMQAFDGRSVSDQICLCLLNFFESELCPSYLGLANLLQLRSQKIRNFKGLRYVLINQNRLVDCFSIIVILQRPEFRCPCSLVLALLQLLKSLLFFFRKILLHDEIK